MAIFKQLNGAVCYLILVPLFVAFLATAEPSFDTDPLIVEPNISALHPGQDGIGLKALYIEEIEPLLKQTKGDALAALQSLSGKVLKGFIAPDGMIWLIDGHHRWIKKYILAKKAGVLEQTTIRVKIRQDFTGKRWDDFYALIENEIYLKKSVRDSGIPLSKKIESLPHSAEELLQRDSPLRSVIKIAFRQLGIKSSALRDFSELKVGDQLESQGFVLTGANELSRINITRAMGWIVSKEGRDFMRSLYLGGPDSEVTLRTLNKATEKYSFHLLPICSKFYY